MRISLVLIALLGCQPPSPQGSTEQKLACQIQDLGFFDSPGAALNGQSFQLTPCSSLRFRYRRNPGQLLFRSISPGADLQLSLGSPESGIDEVVLKLNDGAPAGDVVAIEAASDVNSMDVAHFNIVVGGACVRCGDWFSSATPSGIDTGLLCQSSRPYHDSLVACACSASAPCAFECGTRDRLCLTSGMTTLGSSCIDCLVNFCSGPLNACADDNGQP